LKCLKSRCSDSVNGITKSLEAVSTRIELKCGDGRGLRP
jgi:hypothetical protein